MILAIDQIKQYLKEGGHICPGFVCGKVAYVLYYKTEADTDFIREHIGPNSIKLNFITRGNDTASDPFFNQEIPALCIVCGSVQEIEYHHVVPSCYRKYFIEKTRHDVLPICDSCHNKYEIHAWKLKEKLAEKHSKDHVEIIRAKNKAFSLYKFGDKIPFEKRKEMQDYVQKHLHILECTKEALETLKHCDNTFAKQVCAEITDYQKFFEMWRQHFVDTMQPKFLPMGWQVTKTFRNWKVFQELDNCNNGEKT